MQPRTVASPCKCRAGRRREMTLFDWYVIGFIPVAAILIVVALIDNDWDVSEMLWEEEE